MAIIETKRDRIAFEPKSAPITAAVIAARPAAGEDATITPTRRAAAAFSIGIAGGAAAKTARCRHGS